MVSRSALNTTKRWKRRRDEYLTEHTACVVCGRTDNLDVGWNGPKELRERIPLIFRHPEPLRSQQLAYCAAFCPQHLPPKSTKITEHGGGTRGVFNCDCDLCVTRRVEYNRELQRRRGTRVQARRAALKARGLPIPVEQSLSNNFWNLSERGKEHKRQRRQQRLDEWVKDKACFWCGSTVLLTPRWVGEGPCPVRATADIWNYAPERRAEYLKKCQPQCRKCRYQESNRKGARTRER